VLGLVNLNTLEDGKKLTGEQCQGASITSYVKNFSDCRWELQQVKKKKKHKKNASIRLIDCSVINRSLIQLIS
jgi:hypothetical protein